MKKDKFDPVGMVMKHLKVFTKPEENGFLEDSLTVLSPVPSKRNPSTVEAEASSSAIDMFVSIIGSLEGRGDHTDHLGYQTNAYGLVNDPIQHPTATTANKLAAKQLGLKLDGATPEESKRIMEHRISQVQDRLSKELPNWNKLPEKGKVLLLDAAYNTGVTFKKLAAAIERYEQNPTKENLHPVVRESRRVITNKETKVKEPHPGLDNRATRLLIAMGFINTEDEARKMGLDLTRLR